MTKMPEPQIKQGKFGLSFHEETNPTIHLVIRDADGNWHYCATFTRNDAEDLEHLFYHGNFRFLLEKTLSKVLEDSK